MGMTNLYSNLPGHLVEFKDGGLQMVQGDDNLTGSEKSLLILGTAYDGPVMEPVRIDANTVTQLFGSEVDKNGYPNGSTITKYAKQAFRHGFKDVRCMRVTGSQAEAEITKVGYVNEYDEDVASLNNNANGNKNDFVISGLQVPLIKESVTVTNIDGVDGQAGGRIALPYDGKVTIMANQYTPGENITTKYQYIDISDDTKEEAIADTTSDLTIKLYDNATEEFCFDHTKVFTDAVAAGVVGTVVPDTSNYPKVTISDSAGGNTINLVNGVDFAVIQAYETSTHKNRPEIKILFTSNQQLADDVDLILAGDTAKVTIEYKKYTIEEGTVNSVVPNETFDIVILEKDLKDIVVKNGTSVLTEDTDYTVSENGTGTVISIDYTASGLKKEDVVNITAKKHIIENINEGFTVKSKYAGSLYNKAKVKVTKDPEGKTGITRITFTKPSIDPNSDNPGNLKDKILGGNDLPFYFDSDVVKTVGVLSKELENYQMNNVFEITFDNEDLTLDGLIEGVYNLSGGSDGINPTNDEMFEALSGSRYRTSDVGNTNENGDVVTQEMVGYLKEQGAYQLLENYNVDYIYVAGIYAGMPSKVASEFKTSFHHELALICAVLTYRTKMTHGFIDAKHNSNTTLKGVQKYVNELLKYDNLHYMTDTEGNILADSDGNRMDIGWYTSLVVGPAPIMSSDTLGTYYGSPSLAYAALCANIAVQSAPTNKALPNVRGMAYKLSNKQLDALVANKMVVFKTKGEGTTTATSVPYVVDGCTCGGPNCDYSRISTVKIVTDVVDQVREVADPFLGEPNTIEQRNALASLISKRLSFLLTQGEIIDYEFEINATLQQILIGECSISLVLSVPMELRKITTTVALRASA